MNLIQFPAEWSPQSAIQITWPHKNSDWAYILDEITQSYIELSKEYSSPKSKVFINGVLDKLIVDYKEQGIIKKSGRGLME